MRSVRKTLILLCLAATLGACNQTASETPGRQGGAAPREAASGY